MGFTEIHTANVILLDGILVLYPQSIRQLLNMKVYIDVDSDDRLARRGTSLMFHYDPVVLFSHIFTLSLIHGS